MMGVYSIKEVSVFAHLPRNRSAKKAPEPAGILRQMLALLSDFKRVIIHSWQKCDGEVS